MKVNNVFGERQNLFAFLCRDIVPRLLSTRRTASASGRRRLLRMQEKFLRADRAGTENFAAAGDHSPAAGWPSAASGAPGADGRDASLGLGSLRATI